MTPSPSTQQQPIIASANSTNPARHLCLCHTQYYRTLLPSTSKGEATTRHHPTQLKAVTIIDAQTIPQPTTQPPADDTFLLPCIRLPPPRVRPTYQPAVDITPAGTPQSTKHYNVTHIAPSNRHYTRVSVSLFYFSILPVRQHSVTFLQGCVAR